MRLPITTKRACGRKRGEMRAASKTTYPTILVAVALTCLAQEAVAARSFFYQGNDLYAWCQGQNKDRCAAYIMGAIDARSKDGTFCLGQNILVEQIVENIWVYLRDHPETRDKNAAIIIETALTEKFPCN